MCILRENSFLFNPVSSTAESPVKTTLSDDLGSILVSMAALKSWQINFHLTVRCFISRDSSCPDNSDILPFKAALVAGQSTAALLLFSQHHWKYLHNFECYMAVPYHRITTWLNRHLLDFNKQAYDTICEKAISYYDMHATKDIKSYGNWTCPGNDVIVVL